PTHDADGVDDADLPVRDVRRVLSEAVTGDERRPDAAPLEQPERGDAGSQDRGLGVLGELKVARRPRKAEMPQALAERRVRLRKHLATLREGRRERLAHPDFLRAL